MLKLLTLTALTLSSPVVAALMVFLMVVDAFQYALLPGRWNRGIYPRSQSLSQQWRRCFNWATASTQSPIRIRNFTALRNVINNDDIINGFDSRGGWNRTSLVSGYASGMGATAHRPGSGSALTSIYGSENFGATARRPIPDPYCSGSALTNNPSSRNYGATAHRPIANPYCGS